MSPSASYFSPRLAAAFFTIVCALLVVVVLLLAALRPELEDLTGISDDHAEAMRVLARMRGRIGALRSDILDSALAARPPSRGATSRAIAEVARTLDALERYADTAFEQQGLSDLRATLREAADHAARVEAALEHGDAASARVATAELDASTHRADALTEDLLRFNAGQVQQSVGSLRTSLVRVLAGGLLAAALGVAAALVLLRSALAALRQRARLLEARAEEMSAFAGRAAHELRGPLQTTTLALAALRGAPDREHLIERADRSIRLLSRTVDGLLEFARAGGAPSPGSRSDVGQVVDDAVSELAPSIASAGIRVERDVERGLEVAMEAGHLHTVVTNLLANALKYGHGASGGRITITARRSGTTARLAIADDGPGSPAEALPRVFDPLYRAVARGDGIGLGLATVKRLVVAHGGSAEIESEPGRGTAVLVAVPLALGGAPAPSAPDPRLTPGAPAPHG